MLKDSRSQLSDCQSENNGLRQEINNLRFQLEESMNINEELVEKLHVANNAKTQRKIELENQRTHDLVDVTLSPNISYDRYVKDIISSRELLLDQNVQLKAELERSSDQISHLKDTVAELQSMTTAKRAPMNDTNIDSRSKSELLKLIREKTDDKMIWMEYAIKLTQAAVFSFPELLQIRDDSFTFNEVDEFFCESEKKWASFAITLLQKVNESHPSLIQDLINSQNTIPSAVFAGKLTKKA